MIFQTFPSDILNFYPFIFDQSSCSLDRDNVSSLELLCFFENNEVKMAKTSFMAINTAAKTRI